MISLERRHPQPPTDRDRERRICGLGLAIARRLINENFRVTLFARNEERLKLAAELLAKDCETENNLGLYSGDSTQREDAERLLAAHVEQFGSLDVLVNVVGSSDRGLIERLEPTRLQDLISTNVTAPMVASQVCLEHLRQSQGVIINIGSLASRVTPRYLGGYAIAKHALAAMTRQLRLECEGSGVHIGLVCPGPIEREHADSDENLDNRYEVNEEMGIPQDAAKPGGGAKLKRLSADRVAEHVMQCIDDRKIEVIVPAKTRIVMACQCDLATSGRLAA